MPATQILSSDKVLDKRTLRLPLLAQKALGRDAASPLGEAWVRLLGVQATPWEIPTACRANLRQAAIFDGDKVRLPDPWGAQVETEMAAADYVTLVESWGHVTRYLRQIAGLRRLSRAAADGALDLGENRPAGTDFDGLVDAGQEIAPLLAAVGEWLGGMVERLGDDFPEEFFLSSFVEQVLSQHSEAYPLDLWATMLRRLACHPLVEDVFGADPCAVLIDAIPSFAFLGKWMRALSETGLSAEKGSAKITRRLILAYLAQLSPQGPLTLRLAEGSSTTVLEEGERPLLEEFARRLERSLVEKSEQGEWRRLTRSIAALERRHRALEIVAGLTGRGTLAASLAAMAIRAVGIAPDPGLEKVLYRRGLVAGLGSDAGGEPWCDVEDEVREAIALVDPEFTRAIPLLRQTSRTVEEASRWPLPLSGNAGTAENRWASALALRLAVHHRLYAAGLARRETLTWACRETEAPLHASATWVQTWEAVERGFWPNPDEAMREGLRQWRQDLPRWVAFRELTAGIREIAAQTAIASSGPWGNQIDVTRLLTEIANQLGCGAEDYQERLWQWCNDLAPEAGTPEARASMEALLEGLYDAMRGRLSRTAFDLVFFTLHQLFKDALGTRDASRLYFDPLAAPAADLPAAGDPEVWKRLVRRCALPGEGEIAECVEAYLGGEPTLPKARSPEAADVVTALALCLSAALKTGDDVAVLRSLGGLVALTRQELCATMAALVEPAEGETARNVASWIQTRANETPQDWLIADTLRYLLEVVLPQGACDEVTQALVVWRERISPTEGSWTRAVAQPFFDALASSAERLGAHAGLAQSSFPIGYPVFASGDYVEKDLRMFWGTALLYRLLPSCGYPFRTDFLPLLFQAGRVGPAKLDESLTRLVAHTDELFHKLDGGIYYELQDNFSSIEQAARRGANGEASVPLDGSCFGPVREFLSAPAREAEGVGARLKRFFSRPDPLANGQELARTALYLCGVEAAGGLLPGDVLPLIRFCREAAPAASWNEACDAFRQVPELATFVGTEADPRFPIRVDRK